MTDQAELHGLLAKVRDLGATLISVSTTDSRSGSEEATLHIGSLLVSLPRSARACPLVDGAAVRGRAARVLRPRVLLHPGRRPCPPRHYLFDPGDLGVSFFFVLSGFVLAQARAECGDAAPRLGRFWVGRIMRIYPAYVVALAFAVVGKWVGDLADPDLPVASALWVANYLAVTCSRTASGTRRPCWRRQRC